MTLLIKLKSRGKMVVSTACVPSDLYAHVFHFLTSNGLTKAAKYFKKETQKVYTPLDGPSLLDIFQEHLLAKGHDNHDVEEKSKTTTTHTKLKKKRKLQDDSDDCEKSAKKSKTTEITDNIEKAEVEEPEKKKKKKKDKKKKEESEEKPSKSVEKKVVDSDQDNDENANVVVNQIYQPRIEQEKNVPFRRVKEEEIFVPNSLRNNSFEAKRGASGDWGEKAARDLKYTAGKSFRHEKTKKKRGSYRGGNINTSVNSIKFENSDDSD